MIPLRDTIRTRHFPIMTWVILGLNVIVFLFELTLSHESLIRFTENFGLVPALLQSNPIRFVLSIFTSMFMHAGWFHLLSNMWILFIFGDNVEDRMGPKSYLLFYLLSGVMAALMQSFLFPASNIPVVGASGAIAGVLGAYILLYPSAKVVTLIPLFIFFSVIQVPVVVFLGFWFVSQLFSGLASIGATGGGVAWWAHIGGFILGLVASPLFRNRPPLQPNSVEILPDEFQY